MAASVNITAPPLGADPTLTKPLERPESEAKGGDFFRHLLDVINPLQHIPVISTIYRAITGDEISPAAKLAGGTLFGGPIGAAAALASIAVESTTGRDVGEHMMAAIIGDDDVPDDPPQQAALAGVAPAETAPQPQVQQQRPLDTIIWNGLRRQPVAASVTPTPTAATAPATKSTAVATTVPSPSTAAATNGLTTAPSLTADPTPSPAPSPTPNAAPGPTPGPTLAGTTPSAAWLTTALAQAETLEAANARGDTSVRPEPQPWIADAMMQALDQYDALTRQRNRQAEPAPNP